MKIKVTLISVLFTLYTLVCFTPSYFSNSLTNLLSNGFVILAIGLLFIKRYKPSKFMLLTVIYFVFLITMSFVNGSKQADYHLVLSNLKNVLFWAVTEWSVKNDTKRAINTLFYVLLIFVLLDFMSILVFPDGLYYSSIVWSDWNEGKMPLWVLGNKNNRICWYMLLLMLGCWKRLNDGKKKLQSDSRNADDHVTGGNDFSRFCNFNGGYHHYVHWCLA